MKKLYFLLTALCFFTSAKAQIINIPDANFKAKLLEASSSNAIAKDLSGNFFKIDTNNDGQIQNNEALQVSYLDVSVSRIINLIGIEYFYNLTYLDCYYNQITSVNIASNIALTYLSFTSNQLASLDVNNNTALVNLHCGGNQLTSLNLNNNIKLNALTCGGNKLTSLDVTNNKELIYFSCSRNQLSNLNISNNIALKNLDCGYNQLTSLDVSHNTSLMELNVMYNQLTSIDISKNNVLRGFSCNNNRLKSLDLSNNGPFSGSIWVFDNQLESLNLKNGHDETVAFQNNPNLKYICADEPQLSSIQNSINSYGLPNCHVNSYCSFTPGGINYTIKGQAKFDGNNDGCDVFDFGFSNIIFRVIDGINDGSLISDVSGNYSIPVQAGTHTITPLLENPSYFTVSPTNTTVSFPTQASPFAQNFCVTPNGVHPDVEVTVIPVEAARPGFDAPYKIVYKNKGNQVENGSVSLTFDDAKMDYVSSNPLFNSQATNQLIWNYTNLQPFETRTIDVVFNINKPTDSPAVNGGDVLSFTANITSGNTDEMPNDNTFILNQTVVNSFDPNDITCLEGASVSTAKIGDYVHYMIRFENTGSANATNIVVKDVVDTEKYDVNSIVPINGSHDYYTRINGNNVEFIFENINLPFDDATNDGYVSFKIKTKSTLVVGDSFSKNANIYFDYNFPIVTNTATTTIAALSKQDFEFKNYFSLYPNPVSTTLNIETKDAIQLNSINIYNTLGQLVLVVPNAQNVKSVDVSNLSSGNYFIKVNSNKGTSNTKFIKN